MRPQVTPNVQSGLIALAIALMFMAAYGCAGALSNGDGTDNGGGPNLPPLILGDTITANLESITTGRSVKLSVEVSDPEDQALTFNWDDGNVSDGEFSGTGGSVFWSSATAGTFVITCTVTDEAAATDSASVTLTVVQGTDTGPNDPPVFDEEGIRSDVSEPYAGQKIIFSVGATDADGDALSFIWSDNTGKLNFSDESVSDEGVAQATWSSPDTGTYTITVVADDGKAGSRVASASVSLSTTTLLAAVPATYSWMGTGYCENCHPDKVTEWESTLHSQAQQTLIDYGRGRNESCRGCHNVGFKKGGFIDVDLTPQFANVGCESCHGTGVGHPANGPRPSPWNPKLGYEMDPDGTLHPDGDTGEYILDANYDGAQGYGCGTCHRGSRHGAFPEWARSDHALQLKAPQVEEEDGIEVVGPPGEASCMKCHNGQYFVKIQIDGQDPPEEDLTVEQMTDDMHIVCSTCHDPHNAQFESQLRVDSDGPVTIPYDESGGEGTVVHAGKATICFMCHNGRRTLQDREKQIDGTSNPRGFHGNSQGPTLYGIGGFEFPGYYYDKEHPHNTWNEDKCITCHMFSKEYDPVTHSPKVWGHDWVPAWESCAQCHPQVTDQASYEAFKGEQQAEIQALLDEFFAAWPDQWKDLSDPEEPTLVGRESEVGAGDGPPREDPGFGDQYRQALWNYNYVKAEASHGVHNPDYEKQLLESAIAKLAELNAQ